jgi:hypothetical protein
MPQHGTIHDSLYNAFSFGLFAADEVESEDRELLQKLIGEWRSQYRKPNDARLVGKSDEVRFRLAEPVCRANAHASQDSRDVWEGMTLCPDAPGSGWRQSAR